MTELEQIKETLTKMQAQIDVLENRINQISPQCYLSTNLSAIPNCGEPLYSLDYPLSLSAARSLWPYMENEFDRYCLEHKITVWTPTDSEQFYNEYIRSRRRLA